MRGVAIALLLAASAPAIAVEGDRSDLSSETVLDITQPNDVAAHTHSFEDGLRKLGFSGKIASCRGMLDLPAGVEGGDHAYGAVCKLDQGDALICNDILFGHFAIKAGKFASGRDDVAMFTDENCTGD
jgi:hypothetical protein